MIHVSESGHFLESFIQKSSLSSVFEVKFLLPAEVMILTLGQDSLSIVEVDWDRSIWFFRQTWKSTSNYWSSQHISKRWESNCEKFWVSPVLLRSIDFGLGPRKRSLSFEISNRRFKNASLRNLAPQFSNTSQLFWYLKLISPKRYRIHEH